MTEDKMIEIKVLDNDGVEHRLSGPTDMNLNVMELCKAHEIPIEGVCGGMALCASCHVYIMSDHDLDLPSEEEEDMLDQAFFVENNSRLCCQIQLKEEIDGLSIKLAPV
jgi:2Fe-2S ferredoxin